jgi:hypothetical protein
VAFLVAGVVIAPRHRIAATLGLLGVGSWLAIVLLRAWFFPESHPRAYQSSAVPLT